METTDDQDEKEMIRSTPVLRGSLIHDLDNDKKVVQEAKKVEMDITKPEADDILSEEEVKDYGKL